MLLESKEDKVDRRKLAVGWASLHLPRKGIEHYFQFVRIMVARYSSLVYKFMGAQPRKRRIDIPKDLLRILGINALRSFIRKYDFSSTVTHESFESDACSHVHSVLGLHCRIWSEGAPEKKPQATDAREGGQVQYRDTFEAKAFLALQQLVTSHVVQHGSERRIHAEKLLPVATQCGIQTTNPIKLITLISSHYLPLAQNILRDEHQVKHVSKRLNAMLVSAVTEFVWQYSSSSQYFHTAFNELIKNTLIRYNLASGQHKKTPPTSADGVSKE